MSYIFNHIYSKNKDSIISMDNAGWSISKHSQNYMDCLTANFNQRVISLKTDFVWVPLLSRPEPYGLSMWSPKEPAIKGFTSH